MSKSINIQEYVGTKEKKDNYAYPSERTQKTALIIIAVLIITVLATLIAYLAYNIDPIFSEKLIIGFAILGMIGFVKLINHQKTIIKRVKK
ncbi:MAG: hypothetical protein JXQ93_04710 [Flavobacteriaceae bacterium]